MKITSLLQKEALISELRSQDKASVIRELAEMICRIEPEVDVDHLSQVLMEREQLGSTGIGSGVAIPHGKISQIEHITIAFGRSTQGIDFDSQDGEKAHLFFVLVAPEQTAGLHLKALAKLSRLLKQPDFRQKLLEAPDAGSIYQILEEEDEKV